MPGVLVDSSSPLSSSVHQNGSPFFCPVIGDPTFQGMDIPFAGSASSPTHPHIITRNGLSRLSGASTQSVMDPAAGEGTGSGSSLDSFVADFSGISVPFQSNSACSKSYGVCSSPSAAPVGSPVFSDIMALQKFLPSNDDDEAMSWPADAFWPAMDAYSCDEFRMYEFKVRRCMRGRSHDWTECPFAHPGEKARRRDPQKFRYSGTACPDFRKGTCKRGDACEYAHGVFECWLHPSRYRTQPCKDGKNCKRRVCFFAHTVEQLRAPTSTSTVSSPLVGSPTSASSSKVPCYDGSPLRQALASGVLSNIEGYGSLDEGVFAGSPRMQALMRKANILYGHSPTSTLVGHCNSPPVDSPPLSPSMSPPLSPAIPIGGWRSGFSINSAVPAHRRHLDQLRSVPMISIPSFDDGDFIAALQSPHSVNELVGSLQHLQINDPGVGEERWSLSIDDRANVLPATEEGYLLAQHQIPHASVPVSSLSTTYSRAPAFAPHWPIVKVEQDDAVERVESGRLLRFKIYGKIGMENGVESSEAHPDVEWVNDLVE